MFLRSLIRWSYHKMLPLTLREWLDTYRFHEHPRARARRRVLRYYWFHRASARPYRTELDYLRRNGFCYFPYAFSERYRPEEIYVERRNGELPFVRRGGKKLFFPATISDRRIKRQVAQLLREQDPSSPHRYLTADFGVSAGATVIDVGAAEGIFGAEVAEIAGRLVLCEPQVQWLEPLEKTFLPWIDKTEIVPNLVGSRSAGNTVSIDDLLDGDRVDFIKMDAEGAELAILEGARRSIRCFLPKLAVCCYHRRGDCDRIVRWLTDRDYDCTVTEGFILFYHDPEWRAPYFRRVLIRAVPKAAPA